MLDCKLDPAALAAAPPDAPPWADPRLMMALTGVRITPVSPAVAPGELIAPADPKRVAIGFMWNVAVDIRVGPTTDPDNHGWVLFSATSPRDKWFDYLTYGALVNLAWFMGPIAGATVNVVEIYRLQ